MRRIACFTWNAPMPLVWKRRNDWNTGEESAHSSVAVPKFVVVLPAFTYASATGRNVSVAVLIVTVAVAVDVCPSRSVTLAVMTWVPTASVGTVTTAPVPRLPAMLDDQRTDAPRLPFSGSVAVAASRIGLPVRRPAPFAGESMVSVGAA